MNEPRFVDRQTVDALHRLSLEQHGGQDGVRNEHGLESALTNAELHSAMIAIAEKRMDKAGLAVVFCSLA